MGTAGRNLPTLASVPLVARQFAAKGQVRALRIQRCVRGISRTSVRHDERPPRRRTALRLHTRLAFERRATASLHSRLVCGHHCLSEAQASIPRGNFVLSEYVELGGGECGNEVGGQVQIVKRTAAQADTVQ